MNNILKKICEDKNIEIKQELPYSPRITGVVERFNQELFGKLRKWTEFCKKDWRERLPVVVEDYNLLRRRRIEYSAFDLVHGKWISDWDERYDLEIVIDREVLEKRMKERLKTYRESYKGRILKMI